MCHFSYTYTYLEKAIKKLKNKINTGIEIQERMIVIRRFAGNSSFRKQ